MTDTREQFEAQGQHLCGNCEGEGVIHTGIAEAPTTQCRVCAGSGIDNIEVGEANEQ